MALASESSVTSRTPFTSSFPVLFCAIAPERLSNADRIVIVRRFIKNKRPTPFSLPVRVGNGYSAMCLVIIVFDCIYFLVHRDAEGSV